MDFEHRASEQIPLLLKLGQEPQALTKAVESGDPNLVYHVLGVLKENYSADKFYMTIRQYPSVNALYAKLCRTIQMGSLEQIYEQEDNFNAQAMLSVRDSYRAQVCTGFYNDCYQVPNKPFAFLLILEDGKSISHANNGHQTVPASKE